MKRRMNETGRLIAILVTVITQTDNKGDDVELSHTLSIPEAGS
jgi:hypothetical protein